MEKKTTQRIIGILVAISFVIILLPLLFNKNNAATTETSSIKAPPFPDSQSPAETVTITPEMANAVNGQTPLPEPKANPQIAKSGTAPVIQTNPPDNVTEKKADDKTSGTIPPGQQVNNTPVASTPVAPSDNTIDIAENTAKKVDAHPKAKQHEAKKVSAHHKSQHSKSVAPVKRTAWAIQLGSFKDKNNARRLADRLRAVGYKAFMHETKSAKGTIQTRVYIGPESKQASATQLSNKLAQQLNLHGLVILYKPLEL